MNSLSVSRVHVTAAAGGASISGFWYTTSGLNFSNWEFEVYNYSSTPFAIDHISEEAGVEALSRVRTLDGFPVVLPAYGTKGAAGVRLRRSPDNLTWEIASMNFTPQLSDTLTFLRMTAFYDPRYKSTLTITGGNVTAFGSRIGAHALGNSGTPPTFTAADPSFRDVHQQINFSGGSLLDGVRTYTSDAQWSIFVLCTPQIATGAYYGICHFGNASIYANLQTGGVWGCYNGVEVLGPSALATGTRTSLMITASAYNAVTLYHGGVPTQRTNGTSYNNQGQCFGGLAGQYTTMGGETWGYAPFHWGVTEKEALNGMLQREFGAPPL